MSVTPTLDHVVVNARDDLAGAEALYRRLGFALTPRGRHTLGSVNHLAMFGTDYLELIAAPPDRPDLPPMRFPVGLNAIVFGTEDAGATHAALAGAGVAASPPLAFSRPVVVAGGDREASFRIVDLPEAGRIGGRAYFCQHETRSLVWRDEWRQHPNGVVGVEEMVIAAHDPAGSAGFLARMLGAECVTRVPGGVRVACGLTRIDILAPPSAETRLGENVPIADGREAVMAGLGLRVVSRARTGEALRRGEIPLREDAAGRIVVPAVSALGVVLVFGD